MKYLLVIAHPNYYKRLFGWKLKHLESKWTQDKLVRFIASEIVPETFYEPYSCGTEDTSSQASLEDIYKPYMPFEGE